VLAWSREERESGWGWGRGGERHTVPGYGRACYACQRRDGVLGVIAGAGGHHVEVVYIVDW
jgi:hypothetical protein